jgi:hypothetical protein
MALLDLVHELYLVLQESLVFTPVGFKLLEADIQIFHFLAPDSYEIILSHLFAHLEDLVQFPTLILSLLGIVFRYLLKIAIHLLWVHMGLLLRTVRARIP